MIKIALASLQGTQKSSVKENYTENDICNSASQLWVLVWDGRICVPKQPQWNKI